MTKPFEQLVAVARDAAFARGARLVRQGEPSRGAFLIRSGVAEASVALPGGGTQVVAEFRECDMFGEAALVERGVVTATVAAKTDVAAWFVGRDDFRALAASRAPAALEVQRAVARALAAKLGALNARLRGHPAAEDRPAREAPPAGDPLSGVRRSTEASFAWQAFLPALAFFEGFDEVETSDLVSRGKVLELPRGAWVFTAGSRAQACYVVLRGALEMFLRLGDRERRVAIAGPGELVGFMAVIEGRPRANHARVREGACLLELPAEAFLELYHGNSGTTVSLQQAIHRSLMRSLARTNTQLSRILTHSRLTDSSGKISDLEAALHGQVVQSSSLTDT